MKFLTFGEIMLRLKAPGKERFFQSPALEATFGGGEANVAVSLAHLGREVSYVTAVPDKTRGQAVAAYIIPSDPSLTVAEMIDYCNRSPMLSQYKRPRYYRFVDALPFTATGKKQPSLGAVEELYSMTL